jgi:hypothetical protein
MWRRPLSSFKSNDEMPRDSFGGFAEQYDVREEERRR